MNEPTQHEEAQDTENMERYLKFSNMYWISIVLCLAILCVAADNTIFSTADPRITTDFHSVDDVGGMQPKSSKARPSPDL